MSTRSGVALPLALFTIVLAAVMITAVFYVGRLEQRMGNNSIAATRAFAAAEAGIVAVMENWSPTSFNSLPNGVTVALPAGAMGSNTSYLATVRRLNTQLYLIQAEGTYSSAGRVVTRRQLGQIVRLETPTVLPEAALINRVGLTVTGSSAINGDDLNPAGWSGCGFGPDVPAIVDSTGAVTTTGACASQACLSGAAQVVADSTISTTTFAQLGGAAYSTLAASADKVFPAGSSTGWLGPAYGPGPTCQTNVLTNWGGPEEQLAACAQYLPIIHALGDLDIPGGTAQGLLLVDGDLTISGPLRFYGVAIVNGKVTLGASEIHGTLFVRNQNAATSTLDGTLVRFSRCAIQRAASRAALAFPLGERGWVQLY